MQYIFWEEVYFSRMVYYIVEFKSNRELKVSNTTQLIEEVFPSFYI